MKKHIDFRENLSKLTLDIGKMIFGGVCIAGLVRGEIPHVVLFTGGFVIAILLFVIGMALATIKEKTDKENKE